MNRIIATLLTILVPSAFAATNFPSSFDSYPTRVGTDALSVGTHSEAHNDIQDAVEALEAKVGADGSAVTTSHDYKMSLVTSTNKAVPQASSTLGTCDVLEASSGIAQCSSTVFLTGGTVFAGDMTGTYDATVVGNAATATALAANGANCSAGQYPLGVDASGAVESCTADVDTHFSGTGSLQAAFDSRYVNTAGDTMTGALSVQGAMSGWSLHVSGLSSMSGALSVDGMVYAQGGVTGELTGNASTASALAANGANCSAGQYPLGVDASGAVESCTADSNTTYTASEGIILTGTSFSRNASLTGTSLQVSGTLAGSGALSIDGAAYLQGGATISGTAALEGVTVSSTLQVTGNANFAANLSASGTLSVDGMSYLQGGITGELTGNASTATALAGNGANCSAGNAPLGVDTSGAVESCFDVLTQTEASALTVSNSGALVYGYDGSSGLFAQEDAQQLIAIHSGTFTEDQIRVEEAPTGAAVIVDVKECAADCSTSCTTIFSTKPEVAATATSGSNGVFSDTTITAGQCYVFDVDQIGSGGSGTGLTLQIGYSYSKSVQ